MLSKFLNAKKLLSIFCAMAILATALPLNAILTPVTAAPVGDIIDFEGENAADIVAGNDAFSLVGQDKEDKYYFYAKNNTADTLTLTFDDIELKADKKYTLDFDVYTLRLSKADDNSLLKLKVYGDNEISAQASVSNLDICEENWANYHTEFVAKESDNKLDFSISTFGKVFIDNFVLIDEDGKETALDVAKACANTAHPDHFSYETLYDIAYDEIDVVDGYLKAAVPENSNTIHNEGVDIPMNLSQPLEAGRYKVTLDLKFTSLGTCRNSFCVSVAGNDYGIIQQKWIDAVDIELNKYATYSYDFNLTSEHHYFRFNVYQGCTAYIDNVILTDATGSEVVKFDFDSPVNFSGAAFEQKGIPKTKAQSKALYTKLLSQSEERDYVVLIDNSNNSGYGQLYLNEVGMPYENVYPTGEYTIKFDFYALEIGSSKNIVAHLTSPGWSGDAFPGTSGQKWLEIEEKIGEWQTVSFDITTIADGQFPWFYIGAGLKGYFDNYQIIKKGESTPVLTFSPKESDLDKKSKEICKVVEFPKATDNTDNYAVLIDNSNNSGYGQLYLNEVGMPYENVYPTGEYTIKFDFYALEIGSSKNIVAHLTSPGWSGDAFPGTSGQKWLEIEEKIGEWQTVSFDITTIAEGQFPWFYIGAGIKGYFDNYKIIKKGSSTPVLDFSPVESDLGKTSKEICTVVKVPGTEGGSGESTDSNKVMLIDTTSVADDGSSNKSFWFNELGMASYYNKLVSGKKYTITFDVYPLQKSTGKVDFFHYRTSSGSASSDAGWWGSDLELNKWQTTSNTFTVSDASKTGNHILFVYGGFKGYIDNVKLVDENGNTVEGTFTDIADLTVPTEYKDYLEITEFKGAEEPEKSGDFGILIDNSKGTNFGQLYLHEVGMSYDTIYPVGNYTIKFKFYALEISSNKNIVVCMSKPDWSGNAFPGAEGQKWLEIENKIGEWQELSFDITTIAEGRFPNFHIGAGIKGYFDDFKIINKKTSETMLDFSPVEADLGKTSKTINTVVELPVDVADAKNGGSGSGSEDLSSGMKITALRGRAGKNGASIKLGGAKSPLTLKSNTSYRLSFKYYQANPTDSGILNLFGINAGFDNDIAYFKKNNTTGWANGTVYFTTGTVADTSADWLEIILNANAWVYFDDFKLVEQALDNNKEVKVIDFKNKDDSIYPNSTVESCQFGQSSEMGGTFKAINATKYTNTDKNSNRQYSFKGIKMKSNTTYSVSLDYYVSAPFNDYAAAFGYSQTNLGNGSGNSWPCFIDNETVRGWHTVSFIVTTGDVVPNADYINLAFYDVNDSSEPRIMYFDNLTLTELYKISTSSNDASLGTFTRTFSVEGGKDAKVVANAYEGVTFEGWYEYGDLVSKDKTYRLKNVNDNHKLEARFSGEVIKPTHIVQGFEDYDLGPVDFEWYEVVNDSKNVLEGKQSLHVKGDKITESIEASIFFPLVSSVESQLKDDYTYDVYVWVKPTVEAESQTYFAVVHSESRDLSDMIYSGQLQGAGVSTNIKPHKASALEEKNGGWLRYQIGTITKQMATMEGYAFQLCKFHANRMEGASIDDFYIDCVEVVERTPDFANLKFTEKFFNEISNSDFEEKVTDKNWAPLTNGLTVEKVQNPEYEWQGKYQMKFDAAKSNGQEYVRIIPIGKPGKNYTFAAWTKLSQGSDITVGLYKDGRYSKFENIVNGKNGTLPMIDNGKWNRVSFTFNTGDSTEAYLVIKGTKGTLLLDMVELFIAERGYKTDPNIPSDLSGKFEMVDPIAFPDKVITDTITIEDDVDEFEDDVEESESKKKTKKKRVVVRRVVGGIAPWVWILIGVGALVVIGSATVVIILIVKRKKAKKEAKQS